MAHLECTGGVFGPPFDPFGEPATASTRWKVWMRNFQYYVDGQIGLGDKQKIARLLHQAGPEVQEIYDTIQNEEAEGSEYEKCVKRLNSYFEPVLNTAYERQKFRNLEMQPEETCAQFILRLRAQARYCNFTNGEEALRDQVIEKCTDVDLKRKLIKKGSDLTIGKMIEISQLYEIEKNMFGKKKEDQNQDITVNRIQRRNITCYRCGRNDHLAKDKECPAIEVKCDQCGLKGHFAKCCKTKSKVINKRKTKKRYVKYIIEEDSDSDEKDSESKPNQSTEQVNSVFEVSEQNSDNKCDILFDNKVMCKLIIDSGASINIIDKNLFKKMLSCGVSFKKVCESEKQKFYSYGGREISQLGIFEVKLCSPETGVKINAKILVYNGQGPALLSKSSSVQLGLLRLGPNLCNVNMASEPTNTLTRDTVLKEFSMLFEGVGKLKDFQLKIPIDPNVKLVAQHVRRQPYNVRDIEEKLIKELIDCDIIEPVTGPTPCVSPSQIIRKKEKGQYRLVVDMRKANEAVLRERVPLPTFEELLADLNGCKYFSTLDIKWGYHQLEIDEDSRMITVFSSSLGLFRYKRLFFGIRCTSEMFQRIIAQLLHGIEGVANSQDDIRIGGRTREEHDYRIRQVLNRLKESGITLNKDKCLFGETEINFLGHHLSAKGTPTSTSQQVIQGCRPPQNKAEVRSFLGMVNFSARFIPNFSTLTEPLRHLTKKDTEFIWNKEHEEAFNKLKMSIVQAPALGYYDRNAATTIITDASPVGIAAVLVQNQLIDGKMQPIAIKYVSKALSPTEQRYSQTEKEALAIVWACENLYMYLIGKQFNIVSDHKPLEIIYSSNSKPSARVKRWVLRLQPYTFKVIYKPGKSNIADPVSRLLDTKNAAQTDDNEDNLLIALIEGTVEAVTLDEIQEATLNDPELKELLHAIQKDAWSKELRKYELIKMELCDVNNIILRGTRIIIPRKLIPKILELGHEGHLSVNSMKAKLRSKVWWKSMDKDIEYWVDTCDGCRLVRQNTHPEPLVMTKLPTKVWQLVAIDYLGPLPSGHYLLFVVDYYSRYYEVEILKNQTAESTIKTLEKIIAREGIMDEIICDNGPAFRDEGFNQFLKSQGIKLRHTTPLWPQANGEVERQNRNVLRRLRIAQGLKLDWRKELLTYLSAYRSTPHSSTGVPPGNVFRGRVIKTKIPEMSMDYDLHLGDEEIRDTDRYKKDCYKRYADSKRLARPLDISPGDKVLVKQRKENKLSTPFSPVEHTVVWKSGNTVAVQAPDGREVRRNSSHFQPIKRRDYRKFTEEEEGLPMEEERSGEIKNGNDKQNTRQYTDMDNTYDNLPNSTRQEMETTKMREVTVPQTRPTRKRQTPGRYNDFLLSLIIDTMHT